MTLLEPSRVKSLGALIERGSERLASPPPPLPRLPELDGLRALLAWWVVIYHARSPNMTASSHIEAGPLAFLGQGSLAVNAFMILSGFVIFFLLDRAHEGYRVFLLRRFLRLFPVYAACLFAMLLLQGVYVENLRALAPHLAAPLLERMLGDALEPMRQLGTQLAAHAVMLHGAIPETWLRNSAGAFLIPAWSISLEWQFYLVAPLAFWLVQRGGVAGAALWLLATAVAFATRRLWPEFAFESFLPLHLHTFTVGIASYYVLKLLATSERPPLRWLAWGPSAALLLTAAFLAIQTLRHGANGRLPGAWLPLAIWGFVFACLVATQFASAGPLARATQRVLLWRPLGFLGSISYSTYLVHWPLLTIFSAIFLRVLDAPSPPLLFGLHAVLTFPLIVIASWALHRWVEEPGMALGRRLAARSRSAARDR